MIQYHESKIVPLIGTPDGAMRDYVTPTAFVTGTIKVIWNGVVFEPTDDRRGWTEVSDNVIRFGTAPKVGDELSCFYQELSTVPGIGNVMGSPFHPSDAYP